MAADVKAQLDTTFYKEGGATINKYMVLVGQDSPDPSKKLPIDILNTVPVNTQMQNRIDIFNSLKVNFTEIYFRGITDDEVLANAHETTAAPMVVVSSGRAGWIKKVMLNGRQSVSEAGNNFTNTVEDTLVFKYGPVPIYYPERFKPNERSIYIFVHQSEYEYYKSQLSDFDVTIIGWSTLRTGWEKTNIDICLGFGMSRFVIFQFFKDLYSQYPDKFAKIWMMDDNVCHIYKDNNTPIFSTIEAAADNAQYGGVGFGVENSMQPDEKFSNNLYNGRPYSEENVLIEEAINLMQRDPPRFLQQAALWNFKNINSALNFSPYFIGSNEDITFSRALIKDSTSGGIKSYPKTKILKSKADMDPSSQNGGVSKLIRLKNTIFANIYPSDNSAHLTISPRDTEEYDLLDYINNSMSAIQRTEHPYISFAKACEQISKLAMHEKNVDIYNNVPKACFYFPGPFEIIRDK